MKLELQEPAYMRIYDISQEEMSMLVRCLTYKDMKVDREIKRLKNNPYFLNSMGDEAFMVEIERLKSELKKCLLWEDEKGHYTLSGFKNKLLKYFPGTTFENHIEYPERELIPWQKEPTFAPKDYQENALAALIKEPHCNVEMATGVGKSLLAVMMIKYMGLPTILSTPSQGLSKSAYQELCGYFGKANVGLFGAGKKEIGKKILVCVNKSLSLVAEEDYAKFHKYQVLISDESHMTPANTNEYWVNRVLGHVPYRWFLSATQERGDGKDLVLEGIIGETVFSYGIKQAIDEGHLAKLSTMIFDVVSASSYYSSGNTVKMNQEHLYKNQQIIEIITNLIPEMQAQGIQSLVLIDEHSQEEILRRKMGPIFTYARGGSDTNQICKDFNAGKIMCVVGTSAVSTGTNFKKNQLTINWRGGGGSTRTKQGSIGRSTRLDEESGKTECRIIDFRVTNKDQLLRHANARIVHYRNVGALEIVDYNGGSGNDTGQQSN